MVWTHRTGFWPATHKYTHNQWKYTNIKNKLIELLLMENCVDPRGKEKAVGEPLEKFQLSYLGSVFVHTLSSEGTPCKISLAIFISLIA